MRRLVTWLGHSTVLLELGGARLITDPLVRSRVGHLLRQVDVPGDVGRLDGILLSHPHHDHLDVPSLRRLDPQAPVVAPPGAGRTLRGTGRTVHTVVPGDELELGGARVQVVAADHDGRRLPFDRPADAVGFVAGGHLLRGRHGAVPRDGGARGDARLRAAARRRLGPEDGAGPHGPARGGRGARARRAPRSRSPSTGAPTGASATTPPATLRASSWRMPPSSRPRRGSRSSSRADRSKSPGKCEARSSGARGTIRP